MSPRFRLRHGPDRRSLVSFTVFAALTTALTLFIAQQILATGFGDRYELTATFDDVTGLLTGDQVKISGVPVGRVNEIGIRQGRAVVVLEVDRDVRIPEDSTAAVQWRNVMGQRVISLEPGRSAVKLGPGDRIRHTRSVVDLGEIVNALGPLTGSLDPDMLNQVLQGFAQTLDGNEANINAMIRNMDVLLAAFGTRARTIQQLIDDYRTVAEAVAVRDRQIAAGVDNLEKLTEVFAANRGLLDGAVVEVSQLATTLDEILGENEAQLSRIVGNLTTFSETARWKIDKLEKMVQNLPLALRQLFAAVNGGHFMRTNALCLNIMQGPCPFPMRFPGGNGGDTLSGRDEAKLRQMLTTLGMGGG
ncbi:MCE family protein [Thermomonospora cellulosilytica]|uniref:Phospholipid/cholesterol/gamma-HCH transport system substrate-binding protein n=1 Tax=Thermomonospora cellulosilytica TaxID=1411118 RepID=A0A7W3N4X9_9ACTN|nr:MlaD family protein [Thermomonospora cellulosilytica]MBA9007602.1 phospholipid/cholesterol/gamma-HCH transport system substrate-binding protein [Thermomonospora cellulosilytica]